MKERISYKEFSEKKDSLQEIADENFDGKMSEVMRDAVDLYLANNGVEVKKREPREREMKVGVRGVKLNQSENEAFELILVKEDLKSSELLLKLIRSLISEEPYFSRNEILALRESNRQLIAIGRNLNQLMRSINSGKAPELEFGADDLDALRERVLNQSESISDVIQANNKRAVKL